MSLSSWKETATKQAILDLLARAGDENSPDYIPSAERIAAFDNDGTLWVEQPMPAQTGFLLGKLAEQVRAKPALAAEEPYKSIVTRNAVFLQALAQQAPDAGDTFLKVVGCAWEGTSPEAYCSAADLVKLAMLSVHRALSARSGARLLLQVHDELLLECPKAEVESLAGVLREAMEEVAPLKVPLVVDIHDGVNWLEAK